MGTIGTYDKESGLCLHYPQPGEIPSPPEPPPPRITGGWGRPKPPFNVGRLKAGDFVEFSGRNYNNIVCFDGLNAGFVGRLQGWNGNWSITDGKNVLHLSSQWNCGQRVWLFHEGKEVLFDTEHGVVLERLK